MDNVSQVKYKNRVPNQYNHLKNETTYGSFLFTNSKRET